jgi:hypothetical protein
MKIQAGTFRMCQVSGEGDRGSYALAQSSWQSPAKIEPRRSAGQSITVKRLASAGRTLNDPVMLERDVAGCKEISDLSNRGL